MPALDDSRIWRAPLPTLRTLGSGGAADLGPGTQSRTQNSQDIHPSSQTETACPRLLTWSLGKIRLMWFLTVFSEMKS